MPNLSDDQLTSIAQQFHDLSVAISQFRLDQIHGGLLLDNPGIVQLLGLQISLLNTSSSFYLQAAQVTLADADKAAAQITSATKAANDAMKEVQVVNRVINIGSSAGVLAAAIMTGDINQISTAAEGVYTAVKG
jgi:hypothetical protein